MQDIQIPNFYEFLSQKHLDISTLSEVEKNEQRILYNKYRNTLYKKRQRKKYTSIYLHLDATQAQFLRQKAREHNLNISEFIKQSAINYSKQTFLVPDKLGFQQLLHSIARIEDSIKKAASSQQNRFSFKDAKYDTLLAFIEQINEKVIQSFTEPTNASLWLENELKNPGFRKHIISKLLNHIDR